MKICMLCGNHDHRPLPADAAGATIEPLFEIINLVSLLIVPVPA
jgi:hypothetical protein